MDAQGHTRPGPSIRLTPQPLGETERAPIIVEKLYCEQQPGVDEVAF